MLRAITLLLPLSLALLGSLACRNEKAATGPSQPPPPPHQAPAEPPAVGRLAGGTVLETIEASTYTYVRVKTAGGELWAAATQFKVKVGDKVVVPLDMPMENFHSATLNRTFPLIYFTSRIFHEGEAGAPTPNA